MQWSEPRTFGVHSTELWPLPTYRSLPAMTLVLKEEQPPRACGFPACWRTESSSLTLHRAQATLPAGGAEALLCLAGGTKARRRGLIGLGGWHCLFAACCCCCCHSPLFFGRPGVGPSPCSPLGSASPPAKVGCWFVEEAGGGSVMPSALTQRRALLLLHPPGRRMEEDVQAVLAPEVEAGLSFQILGMITPHTNTLPTQEFPLAPCRAGELLQWAKKVPRTYSTGRQVSTPRSSYSNRKATEGEKRGRKQGRSQDEPIKHRRSDFYTWFFSPKLDETKDFKKQF